MIIATSQTNIDEESSKEMIRNKNLMIRNKNSQQDSQHRIRNQRPDYQENASNIDEINSMIPPTLKMSYRDELFYLGNYLV